MENGTVLCRRKARPELHRGEALGTTLTLVVSALVQELRQIFKSDLRDLVRQRDVAVLGLPFKGALLQDRHDFRCPSHL